MDTVKKQRTTAKKRSIKGKYTHRLYPINENEGPTIKSKTPENILIKVNSNTPNKTQEIELKFPEPLSDKITYTNKIANKMNMIFKKSQSIQPYKGNVIFKSLFFLYLFNKYKTKCFIIEKNNMGENVPQIKIYINPNNLDANNQSRIDFINKLTKCIANNEPIIIIPLNLQIQMTSVVEGHSNLLIYRNSSRELEHFEPHGLQYSGNYGTYVGQYLNEYLKNVVESTNAQLKLKGLANIQLVNSFEVCPYVEGIQAIEEKSNLPYLAIEPGGYCSAWSMFFTELCLKNPEISSKEIYDAVLKESAFHDINYLKQVIRGYTSFINNKIAKYFSDIFGDKLTSAKIINYIETNDSGKAVHFLNTLNQIIYKEANPNDLKIKQTVAIAKFNHFKKTIKKHTSSSELSETDKRKLKKPVPNTVNKKLQTTNKKTLYVKK